MLNALLSSLDQESETVIDLQRLLVSTPALGPENGGDGERLKADRLKEWLASFGLANFSEYNAPDARVSCGHRPNVVLTIPGQDTSRTLWIMSHLDVVPVGDPALWNTAPFELHVEGDTIRGRGVEDNHHGLVASVLIAKALAKNAVTPPINLGLLFVADEETGNRYGLDYVIDKHPSLFGPNDLFLVPDSGFPEGTKIEIAEKSILWMKITVLGKQCHASRPYQGINSLRAAAAFIVKAEALYKSFDETNPLFDPPLSTFEPTKKEANVENVNTLPGRDVFYLDCRVLPSYQLDDVIARVHAIGRDIEEAYGVTIQYENLQKAQAAPPTSQDSPIIQKLGRAIQSEYGKMSEVVGIGGGTVAAYLRKKGYGVAVWSSIYENAHQPNEKDSIVATLRDAKIMTRVLFDAV